jgi:oligopeptide transport system substrate-binding protein
MKKILGIFLFFVLLAAVFQTGCTPKSTPVVNTPVTVLPSPTVPEDLPPLPNAINRNLVLDPAVTEDADSIHISGFIYDGLTRLDAAGKPQPALALKWTVSDDQLDYVVDLRQDAVFQSGAVFNADTVLANFNRWFDKADPLHGSADFPGWKKIFLGFRGELAPDGTRVSPFDGIEKVNQYTVLIHLNRPMPNLLTDLAAPSFFMLNSALLAKSGSSTGTSADTVDGTGAYSIASWTESGLALTPKTGYWGTAATEDLQFPWK